MEDVIQGTEKKKHKSRHRSPNYPSIGLKTAVTKITALYKQDGLAPSQKLAAIRHMGYDKLHSDAARALSAMKSFGLIEEADERLKLTQRGIDIVVREPEDERRRTAIRVAALSPEIYKELTTYYKDSGLPSDSTLRSELIAVRKFNPDSVDGMMRAFKETLEFADLPKEKVIDLEHEGGAETVDPAPLNIGDLIQWESAGQIQFTEPRKIRGFSPDGQWAFVEGDSTGLPTRELTVMEANALEPKAISHVPEASVPIRQERPLGSLSAPQMRSYSWALSGDFNAKMELFGDAQTEEDIDALADYVDITIKALKRSLKARQGSATN